MSLLVVGASHRTMGLDERGRLMFTPQEAARFREGLLSSGMARAAVVLSTCQRVEIYAQDAEVKDVLGYFSRFKGLGLRQQEALSFFRDEEAVRHLFTVASGLDSSVIGEGEILRQVREAYLFSLGLSATSPFFNRLFERALFVGKRARSEAMVGRVNPDLGNLAVRGAQEFFPDFEFRKIFVIGAGAVAQSVVRACVGRGNRTLIVANRTFQRAFQLAREAGAQAVGFGRFYEELKTADIVFSATSSPHLILRQDDFGKWGPKDRLFLAFDLAVPRDIDPGIADWGNVRFFDLDSLNATDDFGVARARQMIEEKTREFVFREDLCGASV
ncbi:MAG: glutamyl-tRNA reductase [Candidatus Omnitrophota bacterium]